MDVLFGVCAGLALALVAGVAACWRVPRADEALVVTGRRPRVVRSRGAFVVPGLARVARVDLSSHPFEDEVGCRAAEGIAVGVRVRGRWQVADDDVAVTAAARSLTRDRDVAAHQVPTIVAGAVRAVVGANPAAALVEGVAPARIAGVVGSAAGTDLSGLGLSVTALVVTAIDDPSGYLADLVRPRLADAASRRRIAVAEAEEAAVRAEQAALLARAEVEHLVRPAVEPLVPPARLTT